MKKLGILAIAVLFTFTVSASNGEGELAKISNYKEVVSKIEYPQVSKEQGVEGKVIVSINIDEMGKMKTYKVMSSPCKNLSAAVVKSLKSLQFTPAKDKDGNSIEGKVVLPVDFKLTI